VSRVVQRQCKDILYPLTIEIDYCHFGRHFNAFMSTVHEQHDPICFEQDVKDPVWYDAMNVELHGLERNGTWEIIKLPLSKRVIGCKRLLKTN